MQQFVKDIIEKAKNRFRFGDCHVLIGDNFNCVIHQTSYYNYDDEYVDIYYVELELDHVDKFSEEIGNTSMPEEYAYLKEHLDSGDEGLIYVLSDEVLGDRLATKTLVKEMKS